MSRIPQRDKKRSHSIIGMLLGLGFLVIVLLRVDLHGVADALRTATVGWFAMGLGAKLFAMPLKIIRWRIILGSGLGVRPLAAGRAALIGWFGNVVLPFELGTLARIQILRRHNDFNFSQVAATLLLERLLDLSTLLMLFLVGAVAVPVPSWARSSFLPVVLILAALVVSIVWISGRRFPVPGRFRDNALAQRLGRSLESFATGLAAVRSPHTFCLALAISLCVWAFEVFGLWCLLRAFNLNLSLLVAAWVQAVLQLGLAVKAAPAGIGTHQVVMVLALGLFSVEAETATALSLSLQVGMIVSIAAIGATAMWLEGVSPASFRKLEVQARG